VSIKRPSGLTLLAGALLLLMPGLAMLQFYWVGRVSEAERGRMQRNVDIAALQFRQAFDWELGNLWRDLQVSAATVRDGSRDLGWTRYVDRYDRWINDAAHPRMLKDVYVVALVGDVLGVRRWDPAARTFVTLERWPPVLERWRHDFELQLLEFYTDSGGDGPSERARFDDQDSLLITPLGSVSRQTQTSPATGSRQQTSEQVFGYTVLELNMPYIQGELLPELAQRHFTHPNGDTYRVAVIASDDEREIVYRSDPAATIDPERADTRQGFFFTSGGPGRGGARRMAPAASRGTPPLLPPEGQTIEELPGRWRLLVQHQSGSLEAAVTGARTRNLAISFGVLMLLTVSIGLLAVTSRRAQRLAQQQMEFVAGVSHELRTPVAVIKSAAENLSQGIVGTSERVKRYGQMIEGESRRLGEMIERVLQYAGIESGLGYGAKVPLAPAEVIQSAVDSALPLLGPETVTVERHIVEPLPLVTGDAAALRSAVQNLVANAVKYGGPDRWVGIRAEHVRGHRKSQVRITVSDHGRGIPQQELPHIFDPFYRGADAVARQVHGNGLGLSLVKRIVTAHGGQVSVSTRAGTGSSFTITLPAADADAAATVAHEAQAVAHS
jgi:two-component system, OmpR family, sensor histidine kinase SenX3